MARNSLYRHAYMMRHADTDNDGDMEGVKEMMNWEEWSFENPDGRNPSRPPDPPDPKPTKIKTTDIDGEE